MAAAAEVTEARSSPLTPIAAAIEESAIRLLFIVIRSFQPVIATWTSLPGRPVPPRPSPGWSGWSRFGRTGCGPLHRKEWAAARKGSWTQPIVQMWSSSGEQV
ncbi:hypothetical protein Kisp01_46880 [Kineosporia sp. NBRC 101677]|nr:hypothetical protein Kisp01_46880 [Kineosporia sp. NBRC 101677]